LSAEVPPIRVLAIAGSLRKGSVNKALVRAAIQVAPPGVIVEDFGDLGDIPLFNEDIEKETPGKVKTLKAKVAAADAILMATPEYNNSVPGVLKNAIDWASRPMGDNSFEDKAPHQQAAGRDHERQDQARRVRGVHRPGHQGQREAAAGRP
jgi:NAD(P)H-dependent FMN reductase